MLSPSSADTKCPSHSLLALFDSGRLPTDEEKWRVYAEIVEVFGCSAYTRHQHSNWCTGRERSRLQSPRSMCIFNQVLIRRVLIV